MKARISLLVVVLMAITAFSCNKEKSTATPRDLNLVANALDSFANTLSTAAPTQAQLGNMIRAYLQAHPTYFYGATVTLLDSNQKATYSPYFYRHNGGIDSANLMEPAYKIDIQAWLREPIDSADAIWSEAYFDSGGGNIWMRTRSVPVFIGGKMYGVATTDIEVEKP